MDLEALHRPRQRRKWLIPGVRGSVSSLGATYYVSSYMNHSSHSLPPSARPARYKYQKVMAKPWTLRSS